MLERSLHNARPEPAMVSRHSVRFPIRTLALLTEDDVGAYAPLMQLPRYSPLYLRRTASPRCFPGCSDGSSRWARNGLVYLGFTLTRWRLSPLRQLYASRRLISMGHSSCRRLIRRRGRQKARVEVGRRMGSSGGTQWFRRSWKMSRTKGTSFVHLFIQNTLNRPYRYVIALISNQKVTGKNMDKFKERLPLIARKVRLWSFFRLVPYCTHLQPYADTQDTILCFRGDNRG